ncbi:MAG: type VI secretion system-associated FHA domain protein TagH [Sphingobacteriia bacterium]|nr:type VI secretion system-associated FHA domain protein TagH [Sphingobacteriia bacterium]NCC39886.1 type VI secretion system-associated FHA domain protein TagH [Gammaproteobacteria bacterium]
MRLRLSVRSLRDQGSVPNERVFTLGTIIIGRGRDCTLLLDDSERVVSSHHARIQVQADGVWITDLSRNGTYLNQSDEPLPAQQPQRLHSGDRLTMGHYELLVGIETEDEALGMATDALAGWPPAGTDARIGLDLAGPSADILDLLGEGERRGAPAQPSPAAVAHLIDDPFADAAALDSKLAAAPPAPEPSGPYRPTPVEHVYFRPPEPQDIPDDYDLLSDAWSSAPAATAPADGPSRPAAAGQAAKTRERAPSEGMVGAAAPILPEGAPRVPVPARGADWPPAPPPVPPVQRPAQVTVDQPPIQGDQDQASADAIAAFIEGLGCADAPMPAQPEALMREAGALLRALAGGLMLSMMGRARFKNELRLGVTTIRPRENNPFKFSVDPDDLLERLLFRPGHGFLPAETAAREAFDDINAHEMAMTAGLQAALRALLARFEPSALEQRLTARSGLDRLLPIARKSHYWDRFTAVYEEVAADASEDFMRLFGDAFASAYQDQIERLRRARGQDEALGRPPEPAPKGH